MLILGLNMFHADASAAIVLDGEIKFAIQHDRRGGVGMEHVEAQNQHELAWSPPTFIPHSGHWFELELRRAASIKAGAPTARLSVRHGLLNPQSYQSRAQSRPARPRARRDEDRLPLHQPQSPLSHCCSRETAVDRAGCARPELLTRYRP